MGTSEYSHPELYGFIAVSDMALLVISCISCVDSSPIFFFRPIFCRRNLASHKKFYARPLSRIYHHIMSNVGIMAGNRDTNRISLPKVEN